MMLNSQVTGALVRQITNEVLSISADLDKQLLYTKVAGILSLYHIKPIIMDDNLDILDKTDMFIAAKRLEGLSSNSIKDYTAELNIFAGRIEKSVIDIDTQDVRTYLTQFPTLKTSSIAKKISVLKSFFGWLTDEEILAKNPMNKIKNPKKEKRLPKALSIEELEMLREGCEEIRERALVEVFYATGCRLSEVVEMNKADVDWQAELIRVIGKGNSEREVLLSHKAMFHLKKYLASRLDDNPALFVTTKRPYNRLGGRSMQRDIKTIAERAAIKKNVHPHILRHTFGTLTLNNGADLSVVQELLGHSSPSTTQIYAQVTDERKKQQYKRHLVQ